MGFWSDVAAKSGNNAKPLTAAAPVGNVSAAQANFSDDWKSGQVAADKSDMASPVSDGATEATPNVADSKFWTGLAAPSSKGVKNIRDYSPKSVQAANYQVNAEADVKTVTPRPNSDGKAVLAANDKGTTQENVTTTVSLARKRIYPVAPGKYDVGNQLK